MDTVIIEPQKGIIVDILVKRNIHGKFKEDFYIHSDDKKTPMKKVIIKGNVQAKKDI